MRTYLLLTLLLFSYYAKGQDLLKSPQSAPHFYLFQLDNEQAKTLYTAELPEFDLQYLNHFVDSFLLHQDTIPELKQGHYLKVEIVDNQLVYELQTYQPFLGHALNNTQDLCLQILDLKGKPISDASVKIKNRRIPYDEKSQAYRLKKSNRQGLLTVSYQDVDYYYEVDRRHNRSFFNRLGKGYVQYGVQKYIYRPIKFIVAAPIEGVQSIIQGRPTPRMYKTGRFFEKMYARVACLFDDYYCEDDYYDKPSKYTGYFVTNQPIYRPGDTLFWKAFVVHAKSGKPLKKQVDVYIGPSYRPKVKLPNLAPKSPGAYAGHFVLVDSLDLRLDQGFSIGLNHKNRKILGDYLRLEDYELAKNELAIRLESEDHYQGDTVQFYVKASDENDLFLPDGRVEILGTISQWNKQIADITFAPDTLFYIEKELDPREETTISIPDENFPSANFQYEIQTTLQTSDNERLSKSDQVDYYYQQTKVTRQFLQDSILFKYLDTDKEDTANLKLVVQAPMRKSILDTFVQLPLRLPILHQGREYIFSDGEWSDKVVIEQGDAQFSLLTNRLGDSIVVNTINPQQIPFNYFFYEIDKEEARGFTTRLDTIFRVKASKNAYLMLRYVWAGRVIEKNYGLSGTREQITIETNLPTTVYPGQEQEVTIKVTDEQDKPVPQVDLTAYGLTKKFKDYKQPGLPNLSKEGKTLSIFNTFDLEAKWKKNAETVLDNYPFWKEFAKLDELAYYQFLFPQDSIYRYSYATKDSTSQLAPYVREEVIHILEIDRKPVYFSWTTNELPYAFRVNPGYHQLRLRTSKHWITIDSLWVPPGEKLIISLSTDLRQKGVHIQAMKEEVNAELVKEYRSYLMPYQKEEGIRYLQQGDRVISLDKGRTYQSRFYKQGWAGPIYDGPVRFMEDSISYDFRFEAGFEYTFGERLLKMKSYEEDLIDLFSLPTFQEYILDEEAITQKTMQARAYRAKMQQLQLETFYDYPQRTTKGKGALKLKINKTRLPSPILHRMIIRSENPYDFQIIPGNNQEAYDLAPGFHSVFLFFEDARYIKIDSLPVEGNGILYAQLDSIELSPKDSFSIQTLQKIQEALFHPQDTQATFQAIQKSYFKDLDIPNDWTTVSGYITDDTGDPLIGASILVKGTNSGTVTDIDGYYSIKVPPGTGDLFVSYTGFSTQEISTNGRGVLNVGLENSAEVFDEIVVTGLGIAKVSRDAALSTVPTEESKLTLRRKEIAIQNGISTAEVTGFLQGVASGVEIRGLNSIQSDAKPLYLIDGLLVDGLPVGLRPDMIAEVTVLKNEQATAIYGSKAADGVIIINTTTGNFIEQVLADKDKAPILEQGALETTFSIRDQFRDYAFWQPNLVTDANGEARFKVTFPDDVTNWRTFVLAMDGKRHTAQLETNIKAYKPLMGQLNVPRFLVQGDTSQVIAKALNYSTDTVAVSTSFSINEEVQDQQMLRLEESVIDTFLVVAPDKDTISVQYIIQKEDGYQDGEKRPIPIFPQGIARSEGYFFRLNGDTSLRLDSFVLDAPIHLRAEANLLKVLEFDLEKLQQYRYQCNEQLASQLGAYLAQQRVANFRGEKFKDINKAQQLINRLESNQNREGGWGWWRKSSSLDWITHHVLRTLQEARNLGYKVQWNTLEDRLLDQVFELEATDIDRGSIDLLELLVALEQTLDYNRYIATIEQNDTLMPLEDCLRILRLKQKRNLDYSLDTLKVYQQKDAFGNLFYQDTLARWLPQSSPIFINLLVLEVLQNDPSYQKQASSMRQYLLRQRFRMNTYERAQWIALTLPALLQKDSLLQEISLSVNGRAISTFPLDTVINAKESLSLQKSGTLPLYLTAYQEAWQTSPEPKRDLFELGTSFTEKDHQLVAGETTQMIVELEVKQEANYVMVEIPIPAGCSYAEKKRGSYPEVYREHYKNYVAVFYKQLPIGKYKIAIDLLPRYSGRYQLNPAKAELMYFPIFSGNNKGQKVLIH